MSVKVDEKTTSHPLLPYLKAISQEPPSCTLLTNDGGRLQVKSQTGTSCLTPFSSPPTNYLSVLQVKFSPLQVQSHLLSVLSPFLAALLAQAGPQPAISLPCDETLLRSGFSTLIQFLKFFLFLQGPFYFTPPRKGFEQKGTEVGRLFMLSRAF